MDKIKRFIDCYIPTETCNLRCHYCYIAQLKKFNNKIAKLNYPPEYIRKSLSKNRLGGICLFNLCAGGETLIAKEVIDVIKVLLEEGHYVMVVTNGTLSHRFDKIIQFPEELLSRLFFKFSFHYLELLRLKKLDEFFDNINRVRTAGCSFTLEITPNDEIIPRIEEIKQVCMDKLGVFCHVTIARDDRTNGINHLSKYNFDDYQKIWESFESNLFEFKTNIFYKKRKEFCYAGDWSLYLNLVTGDVRQCYCGHIIQNIYEDIDEPIKTLAVGNNCSLPHCYNGHAFIALGVIPELNFGNYAELRDRKDPNGNWLNQKMFDFMSGKLYESNIEYTKDKKKQVNRINRMNNLLVVPKKITNKIKNKIKK